jgi:hypothetical protein
MLNFMAFVGPKAETRIPSNLVANLQPWGANVSAFINVNVLASIYEGK